MKNITIDTGKFQSKSMLDGKGLRFRTKMDEVTNFSNSDISNNTSFHIEWEGGCYTLGDSAKHADYDVSKHKLQHKLSAYASCATLLQGSRDPFNLIVLCPLSMYESVSIREDFKNFIQDNNSVSFILNRKDISLNIKDVTVFAEGFGVPMSNPKKFKGRTVGLLDIGGLNVNGVIFKNMKPIKGTQFTENLGSLITMEKIRKELNKHIIGANIQEYQMDEIIKQGTYLGDPKTSKNIIDKMLEDHFRDILRVAKANNWDTKGLEVVISGGGGLDIGIENIKKYIPQATMSNNPVWDNCIGASKVGEIIYE